MATTVVIAVPFFLLEKTATHMQDPFANRPTDTSVTAIARTIEINLRQMLGESEVPPPLSPQGFYIM
jgi:putative membrane protein